MSTPKSPEPPRSSSLRDQFPALSLILGLIKAIEQDVVPQLQQLGVVPEAAPDLTRPQAGAPALTLVFDREGWSPDLFKRLARRGIACITWHKNFKGKDWPQDDFRTLEVPIHGPAGPRTAVPPPRNKTRPPVVVCR